MVVEDIESLAWEPPGLASLAAPGDGVEQLAAAVRAAIEGEQGWADRVSAALRAGLDFLAARPSLARLLLVDAPAAHPLEYERGLLRLGEALRPSPGEPGDGGNVTRETGRLLAGGLASHLSGRVLAGEAGLLPESHDLLLRYLLAPSLRAVPDSARERRAARG